MKEKKKKNTRRISTLAALASFLLCAFLWATGAAAVPLQIAYMGRLLTTSGMPSSGPVNLSVQFYNVASGGQPLANLTLPFSEVPLSKGVFQIELTIPAAAVDTIFADGQTTYVQVTDTSNGNTYARQAFSAVPYALRVPTDGTTMVYDTAGHLTVGALPELNLSASNGSTVSLKANSSSTATSYTLPASPSAGDYLTTDSLGNLSWASPSYPGLSSDGSSLSLSGSAQAPSLLAGSSDGTSSPSPGMVRSANASGVDVAGASLTIAAGDGTGSGSSGAIYFQTASAASSGTTSDSLSTNMTIAPNGNVGIGTTSPQVKTEIVSAHGASADGLRLRSKAALFGYSGAEDIDLNPSDSGATSHLWFLNASGAQIQSLDGTGVVGPTLALNPAGGNVGIGTYIPQVKTEVVSGHDSIDGLRVRSSSAVFGQSGAEVLDFNPSDTSGYAHIQFYNLQGALFQAFNDVGSSTAQISINAAGGNVGIGTHSPMATLHVSGTTAIFGSGEGATPSAFTLRAPAAAGANVAGAAFNIAASAGSGTSAGGSLNFQAAPAGTSGYSANPLTTYLSITPNGIALATQVVSSGGTFNGSSASSSFSTTTPAVFLTGSTATSISCLGVIGAVSTGQIFTLTAASIGTGLTLVNQASCSNGYPMLTNSGGNLSSTTAGSAASVSFIFDGSQWIITAWNS